VMLLGSMVFVGALLALIGGNDARIRSYVYKMLSSTISCLVGVLANSAVKGIILDEVLPMFSSSDTDTTEVTSNVTIVFGFLYFTSIFVLTIFLSWKFQYRQGRLWAVRKFGSSMCAWGAVFAFQEILKVCVDEIPYPWRLLATPSIAVSAFLLFAIYEKFSEALVAQCFSKPPVHPWPPRKQLVPTGGSRVVETPRTTCMGLWSETQTLLQPTVAVETSHWYEEVRESEDDVLVTIVGFLSNQAIIYGSTEKLDGILHEHLPLHQNELYFWIAAFFALMGISFGLFSLRAYFSDRSWAGSMTQRVLLSSAGFCLYRTSSWEMGLLMGEDNPMEPVVSAVVFSTVSIVIVILVDRTAHMIHRIAPACASSVHSRFQGTRRMTPVEWAMETLIKVLGLLVGLGWSIAFTSGFVDIIESHEVLAANKTVSRIVLSIALILLVLPPWRRIIVPKAEMREKMHTEAIGAEASHLDAGESFDM